MSLENDADWNFSRIFSFSCKIKFQKETEKKEDYRDLTEHLARLPVKFIINKTSV